MLKVKGSTNIKLYESIDLYSYLSDVSVKLNPIILFVISNQFNITNISYINCCAEYP